MDVWKEFDNTTNTCMVQVKKSQKAQFEKYCNDNQITYDEKIKDLEPLLDKDEKNIAPRGAFDYNMYNRYRDVSSM